MRRTHYESGRPRVHAVASVDELRSAAEEYESFREKGGDAQLADELEETARDLREELRLRQLEGRSQ